MLFKVIWFLLLQRIALAYLVVAVLEIVTKDAKIQDQSSSGFSIIRMYFSQWYARFGFLSSSERFRFDTLTTCCVCAFARIVACCILVIYLALVYGIYVPDWEFRVRNVDSPNYGKVSTVRGSSGHFISHAFVSLKFGLC